MDSTETCVQQTPRRATAGLLSRIALPLVLAAIVVFTALRAGDAEFANDEPVFAAQALSALEAGRFSDFGIIGTLGQEYGPVTTQFMQLLLLLGGRDLVATMTWRIVLYMTLLAASLLWFGRALRLSLWFIPVLMVGPQIWYHARLLWDNPWLLPLGVLFLAGYAQCIAGDRKFAPFAVGLSGGLMLLTHPMSAAMPLGVAIHAVLTQRPVLRQSLLFMAFGAAISASTSIGYLQRTASLQITRIAMSVGADRQDLPPPASDRLLDSVQPKIDQRPSRAAAALAAWSGVVLFSSEHRVAAPGMDNASRSALRILRWPAAIGAVLFAAGIALTVFRRSLLPIHQSLAFASLTVLAVQTAIFMVARPAQMPHYQFGAAAATLTLCWIGANLLLQHRAARVAIAVYGLSLIATTLIVAQSLHRNQGTRGEYGPALKQLVDAARRAADAGCAEIWTDIPHISTFPEGFNMLYQQRRPRTGSTKGMVVFKSPNGESAALDFRESVAPMPENFQLIWHRPN